MSRVAIADPDPSLRAHLARHLRHQGWEVTAAAHVDGIADWVRETPSAAALVDVSEPDELARLDSHVARLGGAAVVAMAHPPTAGWVAQSRRAGALACLRKPFAADTLERTLAGVMGRELADTDVEGAASATMREFSRALGEAAATDATVLLVGEIGVGKTDWARRLHEASARRRGPFVEVACATCATAEGWEPWSSAMGGTLVLEEVSDLALPLQDAVLHALDRATVSRDRDSRWVATARRPLAVEVTAGRVREALQHRLNVITLTVPPLRQRADDIPALARGFLRRFALEARIAPPRLTEREASKLAAHRFPGNLRELRNLMRRAVILSPDADVDVETLLGQRPAVSVVRAPLELDTLNLRELERRAVIRSLAEHDGNRTRASKELGISVRTLRNKIREYGLR